MRTKTDMQRLVRNTGMKLLAAAMLVIFIAQSGCKKEDEGEAVTMSSHHNETLSHKNGDVCLSCHQTGGSGTGHFVVAGSVYKADLVVPDVNGTLFLWTRPGGTGSMIASVEVDGLGNFFTTASIMPSAGAYPQIKGSSGSFKSMPIVTTSANCNSCHGVSVARIWVN
jgi:hypothetical protein